MMKQECEHRKLENFSTGTEIRVYRCKDCNKISVLTGSGGGAVKFHELSTLLKAVRKIELVVVQCEAST